jgi:hypothetical protein
MKNTGLFKMLLISAVLSMAINFGYGDSPHAPVKKKIAVNTTTNFKAVSADNGIVINYSIADGATQACIVVSDMMGNKVKVIKLTDGKGKISLTKDNLDNISNSGMYTCSLLVDGSKISSQSVKLLNF